MKFSKQWLQEWVNINFTTEKLVEQLTMAGLEVDSIEPVAGEFSDVIVGEVTSVEPHPNADKLNLCTVNIGQDEPLSIVCGAANVHASMKVAVATIGAVLPGNFKIKKAKLRGVASCGMICSAKELGLAESSDGIMELPEDAPISMDFREYQQLDDVVIDVDLTPNRGDCASLRGIAREVATLNRYEINQPEISPITNSINDVFPVNLTAEAECPRYVGRVIKNVDLSKKTPLWMQERLRRSGIRSIDPVVDITNYVLLELGQPMHAFDLAKLVKGVTIRLANNGEKLVLLNGEEVTLTSETLIIADQEKPIALAGVMGGECSGVNVTETRDIFLESAFFDPIQIAKTARNYGLQSDSSYRFERGVDYQLQVTAIERATKLLLEIVGGDAGPVIAKTSEKHLPKEKTIKLRVERIKKILGMEIPKQTVKEILEYLGMQVKTDATVMEVSVPSYRFDCAIEVDLIEEIARVFGYDNIPAQIYSASLQVPPISSTEISLNRIRNLLQDRDYHEVITYSFVDSEMQSLLDDNQTPIKLLNPIANNMSVMRTNLWPGLVGSLIYNLNRQQNRVRVFETGLRFRQSEDNIDQQRVISGLIYGSIYHEQWGEVNKKIDFYDVKADVTALLALANHQDIKFQIAEYNVLHPGKSAKIVSEDQAIGYVGALHPNISQQLSIKNEVYLFELLLTPVQKMLLPKYHAVSKYPAIRRDLAFLADKQTTAAQIKEIISTKIGCLLTDLTIFDVYEGENLGKNKKSLALGLTLQNSSRTLNDNEVNELIECVIISLEEELGLKLRD